MESSQITSITVPAISNLDGIGTVTESMFVVNVGTGAEYDINSPPEDAVITLDQRTRRLTIDPVESRETQVFQVFIELSEEETPELTTEYLISI